MARQVVIYRMPADREAFDKHYFEVHVPMAKRLPRLRKYVVSRGPIVAPAGWKDAYLIATLYFDSLEDIRLAFASECGQNCAADRRVLAPNEANVQMYLFDDTEV